MKKKKEEKITASYIRLIEILDSNKDEIDEEDLEMAAYTTYFQKIKEATQEKKSLRSVRLKSFNKFQDKGGVKGGRSKSK